MKILVTGANGHVGGNLVPALIARGHQVRASIRDPGDAGKAEPLRAAGAEVVGLDVRRQEPFDRAAEGMDLIFHVAATYAYHGKTAGEIIADSVEGAEAALRASARAGVPKVVLTSSVVTLPLVRPEDRPADESQWQSGSRVPYIVAKTRAEQRAWELAGQLGVKLVTVLPGAIGGPGFARRTATTDVIEGIMLGTMRFGTPPGNFPPYVDVRDVVQGHVLAGETDVSGRFVLCADRMLSYRELVRAMRSADPAVPPPGPSVPKSLAFAIPLVDRLTAAITGSPRVMTAELNETLSGGIWSVSNARAKTELGWRPAVPLVRSLGETMQRIREIRRAEGRRRMA
jgi:dihydroflavonol-4-reductase